jgi:hypothetical protein
MLDYLPDIYSLEEGKLYSFGDNECGAMGHEIEMGVFI